MDKRKQRPRASVIFIVVIVLAALVIGGRYVWVMISTPKETVVDIPAGLDRSAIARILGTSLKWDPENEKEFESTYVQMQWARWNIALTPLFVKEFAWNQASREIFITSSAEYFNPALDFFSTIYSPGTYTIPRALTIPEIAGLFVSRTEEEQGEKLGSFITKTRNEAAMKKVLAFISDELDLLPDLVPFPAQDLRIEQGNGKTVLRFSTTYYNQGKGPLELRGDPATKGIRADIVRDVFQRIYRADGTYRDNRAGTFLWHQAHLHYHFADFVVYDLGVVDVAGPAPDLRDLQAQLSGLHVKSTFCIRDISRIDIDVENRLEDAKYKICGKELQGISVGWGDTYFYNYVDQALDISDLPSGKYRLSFKVNPSDRFEEMTKANNDSSVVFDYDRARKSVKVVSEEPSIYPPLKHIYLD